MEKSRYLLLSLLCIGHVSHFIVWLEDFYCGEEVLVLPNVLQLPQSHLVCNSVGELDVLVHALAQDNQLK